MKKLLTVAYAFSALSAILAAVVKAINGNWLLTTIWSFVAVTWIVLMILINRLEIDL